MGPRIFPLHADGAATDRAGLLGARDGLDIADRTAWPRFGIKGPSSADWLRGVGLDLPEPNRLAVQAGLTVLRLGRNDVMLLAADERGEAVADFRDMWDAAEGPKGYSSWREEGWAWLHLSGPALDAALVRCCAVDLRAAYFPADRIAQTSFAHVDATIFRHGVIRDGGGAGVLFDIAATGAVLSTLRPEGHHP